MMNEHMHLALHRERATQLRAEADADRAAREFLRARRLRQSKGGTTQGRTGSAPVPAQRTGLEPASGSLADRSQGSTQSSPDGGKEPTAASFRRAA